MKQVDTLIILLTLTLLTVVIIMFVIYSFFIRKKGELLLKQQEKELEFQKQLSLSEVEIKEQTLNYIGQELHDDLGQKLSVARMMTNRKFTSEEDAEFVKEINTLLGECIQDIRNLSKTFISDDILHFGIIDSLEREINRINKLNLIRVDFVTNKHDIEINNKNSLILFRIIQESINNVLKHSQAKLMKITIEDSEKSLFVTIVDNGKGIPESVVKSGSGLTNMANRAKLINADFSIDTVENEGTKVSVKYKK